MPYMPHGPVIKVLIVDDHQMARVVIRALLNIRIDIRVVGEASDGQQALQMIDAQQPDVILLDPDIPIVPGDAVLDSVMSSHPTIRVLILTMRGDPHYANKLLVRGAAGYMLKEDASHFLLLAVRSVHAHQDGIWVSPRLLKLAVNTGFSIRELAILRQLHAGKSMLEMAAGFGMSEPVLQRHLLFLMAKVGATSFESLKEIAGHIASQSA